MIDCLVNGKRQSQITITDRGLQYGDGLFETIAVRDGVICLWDRHWQRLSSGCERLGIHGIEENILRLEAEALAAGRQRSVLKVMITRGSGGRGYRPVADSSPTRIIAIYPWPGYPDHFWRDGVVMRICSTPLGRNPALAGLKHLNRLEQVLARREWDSPDIAEGLMLDDSGHVISGTMTNLFSVRQGELITPRLLECGVAGVMRGEIIALAEQTGMTWREADMKLDTLYRSDEIFLSNALIGMWPVRRLDRTDYAVGPVTMQLGDGLKSRALIA